MDPPTQTRTRPDPKPGEPQTRAAAVRTIDVEKRTVTFVASTEAVDAHGTVLVQDWDLDRYRRNPVVLWAHNATLGLDELPIGRGIRAEVVDGALEVDVQFAGADISELAERVFQAYRQEFLRACSVGFNPRSYRWEQRDGREVLVFSGNELLELSCVPVGSNPDALARALARRAMGDAPEIEGDRDFIDKMILHHEMAIAMVDGADGKLKNDELKALASGIKKAQTAEIATMRRIRDSLDDRAAKTAPRASALAARAQPPGPDAPATEKEPAMTEEERKRLEWAARALELLGVKDTDAGAAALRGLLDVRERASKTEAALTQARKDLERKRHAEVVAKAVKDTRLPPVAEWTDEQRSYINGLSAEQPAPVDGVEQRSPLEVYIATLSRRAPVGERVEAKREGVAPAKRAAEPPVFAKQTKPEYVERAEREKAERRASGHGGPRVTDHPEGN